MYVVPLKSRAEKMEAVRLGEMSGAVVRAKVCTIGRQRFREIVQCLCVCVFCGMFM